MNQLFKNMNRAELIARLLVVAYYLGAKRAMNGHGKPVPTTVDDMMAEGNDGLDWQSFLPLANDLDKA